MIINGTVAKAYHVVVRGQRHLALELAGTADRTGDSFAIPVPLSNGYDPEPSTLVGMGLRCDAEFEPNPDWKP